MNREFSATAFELQPWTFDVEDEVKIQDPRP
jgi:hypothetical protein